MSDHTNSGCACTPNRAIKCEVTSCANHCQSQSYCGLNAIQVGTRRFDPPRDRGTAGQSFRKK